LPYTVEEQHLNNYQGLYGQGKGGKCPFYIGLWLFTYGRDRRASRAIEKFHCARLSSGSLISSAYYKAHHGYARKNFSKLRFSEALYRY